MPQLDALRAFAVAAVAYSHWVPRRYHFGVPWGQAGVQLFFVLSGFLITAILLRCREYGDWKFAARAFYGRRFVRIFPLFYCVLLVAFIRDIHPVRETILWHVPYLSNFYFVWNQSFDGPVSHFWSLAVEEQFYVFWPLVVLCIPSRYLWASIITLITTGVLSRLCLPLLFPETRMLNVLPNSNFAALGLGAMLAYLPAGQFKDLLLRFFLLGVPTYFILFAIRRLGFSMSGQGVWEHLAMLAAFTWLISAASLGFHGRTQALLEMPVLLYLGRISYGLYVLHLFAPYAIGFVSRRTGIPELTAGVTDVVIKAAVTVAMASISWHVLESPFNSLKRWIPYKRNTRNGITKA